MLAGSCIRQLKRRNEPGNIGVLPADTHHPMLTVPLPLENGMG
jgi:hypothetical protein